MHRGPPRTSASFAVAALAAIVLAVGCTTHGTPCAVGDYQRCDCHGAPTGYAVCSADGEAYGACDCSGAIPPGAVADAADLLNPPDAAPDAADAADAAEAAALLPFMATCTSDDQCETHNCFQYNQRGRRCTHACSSNGDCVPPSPGCNGMGVCKSP